MLRLALAVFLAQCIASGLSIQFQLFDAVGWPQQSAIQETHGYIIPQRNLGTHCPQEASSDLLFWIHCNHAHQCSVPLSRRGSNQPIITWYASLRLRGSS
jgi:hypothetical protein